MHEIKEDIEIILQEGAIVFFGRKLKLGMKYDEVVMLFSDQIISKAIFKGQERTGRGYVEFQESQLLGYSVGIKARFDDKRLYKIIMSLNPNNILVQSEKTGLGLFQEKLICGARKLSSVILTMFNDMTVHVEGELFECNSGRCSLSSSYDRDLLNYYVVLRENHEGGQYKKQSKP